MKPTPQQIADHRRITYLHGIGAYVATALRILKLDMGTTTPYHTAVAGILSNAKALAKTSKGKTNADTDTSSTRPSDSMPAQTPRARNARGTKRDEG